MKFENPYWAIKTRFNLLERWIIVHSILYYEMDTSVVSDDKFNQNCAQLLELINEYPKDFRESSYYYCIKSFDGSTGFDLYSKLNKQDKNYLRNISGYLEKNFKKSMYK